MSAGKISGEPVLLFSLSCATCWTLPLSTPRAVEAGARKMCEKKEKIADLRRIAAALKKGDELDDLFQQHYGGQADQLEKLPVGDALDRRFFELRELIRPAQLMPPPMLSAATGISEKDWARIFELLELKK